MADENTIVIHYDANLKELNQKKKTVENAMSDIKANPNISDDIKNQLDKLEKLVNKNVDEINLAFKRLDSLDVSSKTFKTFSDKAEQIFQELTTNVTLLNEKMNELGTGVDLSPTVKQFENIAQSALSANKAIGEVINSAGKKMSVSLSSRTDFSKIATELDNAVKSYQKFFNLDDPFAEYNEMSVGSRLSTLKQMDEEFKTLYSEATELSSKMKDLDPNSEEFAVANAQLMTYKNTLQELSDRMATVIDVMSDLGEKIPKGLGNISYSEDVETFLNKVEEDSKSAQNAFRQLMSVVQQTAQVVSREELNGSDGVVKVTAKIVTGDDTLYKQLVQKLDAIQNRLNTRGAIQVPVKLVVEGTPYSASKKSDLTQAAQKALPKSVMETAEGVSADVDTIANRTIATVIKTMKSQFSQAFKDIRDDLKEIFSSDEGVIPVTAEVTQESLEKIKKSLQSDELTGSIDITEGLKKAEETIDSISEKAKQLVAQMQGAMPDYSSTLNDIKEAVSRLNDLDSSLTTIKTSNLQNGTFKIDISDLVSQFDRLISEIKDAREELSRLIEEGNLGSLEGQWIKISDTFHSLADETGKIDFRKNKKQLQELIELYERYVSLGGSNTFTSLTNNSSTLSKLQQRTTASVDINEQVETTVQKTKELIEVFDNVNSKIDVVKKSIQEIKISNEQIKTFNSLADAIEKVEKAFESISTLSSDKTVGNKSKLNSIADFLERIDKLERVSEVFKGLKVTPKNLQSLETLPDILKAISEKLQEIETLPNSDFLSNLSDISKNAEGLKSLATVLSSSEKKINDALKKSQTLSIPKESISYVNSLSKALDKLKEKANTEKFPSEYNNKLQRLGEVVKEFNQIANKDNSLITQEDISRTGDLILSMKDINYEIKTTKQFATDTQITKAIKKINQFLADSTKLTKAERLQLEDLISQLQQPKLDKGQYNDIMIAFNKISNNAIEAGRASNNFFDAVKNKLKYGWAEAFARFFSFYDIIRYIKEVSSTVTELNSNLIELAKVSEASISELYDDFSDFKDIAKETGGTINDIISSTADWARNGYNLPDSKELARLSSIFQNIGDGITEDQANEYLVSTLKGFNLEASQAIEIMDKINNVSNNAASGVQDIGEALERSSASFGAANTDLSESIALLTTANEVLQNPETVGTAFKSMSARLRAADTEITSLEDGFTLTTSKLRDLVQALTGYDIQETEDSYHSIYEILKGIGEEWDNLTDLQQASLSEELFG